VTRRHRIGLALVAVGALALGACDPVGGKDHPRNFEASAEQAGVRPDSRILMVYVGATNCGDCRAWEAGKTATVERLNASGVEYREAISPSYSNTASPEHWPEDIRWITTRNAAYVARGTPRFLVLVDGRIVWNKSGNGGYPDGYLERLLAARSGGTVAPAPAMGGAPVASAAPDVAVSCRRDGTRAVLALNPAPGVKLNAEYGVSVAPARRDRTAWGVSLPYVHKEDADYFPGPVSLTLPIARAEASPSLHVEYGYCASSGLCMADDADVRCE